MDVKKRKNNTIWSSMHFWCILNCMNILNTKIIIIFWLTSLFGLVHFVYFCILPGVKKL